MMGLWLKCVSARSALISVKKLCLKLYLNINCGDKTVKKYRVFNMRTGAEWIGNADNPKTAYANIVIKAGDTTILNYDWSDRKQDFAFMSVKEW
jgi:hypothetical protein